MKPDPTPMSLVLALSLLGACAYAPASPVPMTIKDKTPIHTRHTSLPPCLIEGVAGMPCKLKRKPHVDAYFTRRLACHGCGVAAAI